MERDKFRLDESNALTEEISSSQYQDILNHSRLKLKITTLIGTCMVLTIVLLIAILLLSILRAEKPGQIQKTCMKCSTLSEVIDRWAWKDVDEDNSRDECCFTTENGWVATLKYYFDKRLSGNNEEIASLQNEYNNLANLVYSLVAKGDDMEKPACRFDWSAIIDLLHSILNRRAAVLHLTSQSVNISQSLEPTIYWDQEVNQGNISLEKDNVSIQIMNSALYYVSAQVKFRVNVPSNKTRYTTVQFYVAKKKAGHLSRVDDYKKRYVFHDKMPEHDAVLHTITRLERGDRLIIRFPISQKTYLAVEPGSHRISIFELS